MACVTSRIEVLAIVVFASGVKMAVRTVPVPEMAESVPCWTDTLPLVPSQLKLAPGSSLNVNVMVAVSPILSAGLSLVIVTVGTSVSNTMPGVVPA
jgi:hypothetical protein